MRILDFLKVGQYKQEIQRLSKELEHEKKEKEAIKLSKQEVEYLDLSKEIALLEVNKNNEVTRINELKSNLEQLQQDLYNVNETLWEQSFGVYEPKYGFDNSAIYTAKLEEIRKEQKQLIKDKVATNHNLGWTIGDNKKKGKEFILDTIKLSLRAFNNECDNIVSKVTYRNIEASEKRIVKVFSEINSLTDMQQVSIKKKYLNLKIQELYLKYEYELKKQEEREEQQALKEEMREKAKILKEIEAAKKKIEKEESHFVNAISDLKSRIEQDRIDDIERSKIEKQIKSLEESLAVVIKNKEDVLNREANQNAGYVYIISNIGSFGENVYKIGMTRRLEPTDRVKELGDASVPFLFDIHAMIFAENAYGLEGKLHKVFADKRVNKVNLRKEFFRVSLAEIEKVVREEFDKHVEFTKLAQAEEYRKSIIQ